ncbi:NAD+ synthase (glutamine-hydrolyzing) [Dysgonomonas sp. PH5-45]|uniref:NAD(+) synthase n=1 Tax=unclassified Dysgonomonas TaxID=2630389 RepID=UPI0024747DFF|nr:MULTISPECIES: NAD(+) synthase [unclassified Dysgonomonas]MDH6354225.1 NAD+ synthase (glutamine-hydrolyzing) [Dysgonomonas sp. PH5-45]MDH6387126.1 NAD+ synthase (glutamine-hydrolyzing) [Dysgonomonas sp. PH5-37]
MNNYGFVRVAAASPALRVADCDYNTGEILNVIADAEKQSVSVVVFPETCITGYTAQDLFCQHLLLDESVNSLNRICKATNNLNIISILGMPLAVAGRLYNVGVVVHKGKILGITPKTFMPNNNEFYEKRWFASSGELKQTEVSICGQQVPIGTDLLFKTTDFCFAIELCEDLWTAIPPSSLHALNGAEVVFNLSASPDTVGKQAYRKVLIAQQSARCMSGYVYASAGNGESTTDLVFSGSSFVAESGEIVAEGERFSFNNQLLIGDVDVDKLRGERLKNKSFTTSEYKHLNAVEYRTIQIENGVKDIVPNHRANPTPFVPSPESRDEACTEIFSIQVGGLAKRLLHTGCNTMVVGVSGGLDSTLALLVMAKACDKLHIDRRNIYGITMPGFGTTDRTYQNALSLMESLGVTTIEIPIADAVRQHFKDIDHSEDVRDTTYENSQARERTQILMDYANKVNGLVIGTGDLSELALGWCTYNGDHMSMYAVNTGVPKTLVKTLVSWISETQLDETSGAILQDILDTPVSPELLPAGKNGEILQITEDMVGPYVLHDFFLYNMLRFGFEPKKIYFLACNTFVGEYENEVILKWLKIFYRRFFSQQFKRSCMPDGPKVGSINLSPRGDWRMGSDASAALWLTQLEGL